MSFFYTGLKKSRSVFFFVHKVNNKTYNEKKEKKGWGLLNSYLPEWVLQWMHLQ